MFHVKHCPETVLIFRPPGTRPRRRSCRRPAPRPPGTVRGDSGALLPPVMVGPGPLVSGLDGLNRVQGLGTGGLPAHRSDRDTDCGTLSPACLVPPLSPRTCSGVQTCPGPVPGATGTAPARLPWAPEQVRGDNRGAAAVSPIAAEPAPKSKPDSNGPGPTIHVCFCRASEKTRGWSAEPAPAKAGADHDGWGPPRLRSGQATRRIEGPRLYGLQRMAAWTPKSAAARRDPSSSAMAISSDVRGVSSTLPPTPIRTTGPESGASAEL